MTEQRESWLKTALRRDVVIRSLKISLVVGTILTLINQCDVILSGAVTTGVILKIGLTFLVPYSVGTYAAVQAIRAR